MKRNLVYARISKEERAGTTVSLDRQVDELLTYAAIHGLDVHPDDVFVDDGYSGGTEDRPDWQRVLKLLMAGKVDTLLVTDLSRMHRSLLDSLNFAANWIDNHGVTVTLIHQLYLDRSTAGGRAQWGHMAVSAQQQRETVIDNVRNAMAYRRSRGLKTGGLAPWGWCADASGRLLPVVEEQLALSLMVELRSQGLTYRAIAKELDARGIKPRKARAKHTRATWCHTTVVAVLEAEASRTDRELEELAEV